MMELGRLRTWLDKVRTMQVSRTMSRLICTALIPLHIEFILMYKTLADALECVQVCRNSVSMFCLLFVTMEGKCTICLTRMAAQWYMMLSSIWMAQSFLSLTFHGRWYKWHQDTGGDEAYGDCLLHSGCWSSGMGREMPESILADLRGD